MNHILVYCLLIKSLESLAQATCNNLEHLRFTGSALT